MTQQQLKELAAAHANESDTVVTTGDWQEIDLAYRVGFQKALQAALAFSPSLAVEFSEILNTVQEY